MQHATPIDLVGMDLSVGSTNQGLFANTTFTPYYLGHQPSQIDSGKESVVCYIKCIAQFEPRIEYPARVVLVHKSGHVDVLVTVLNPEALSEQMCDDLIATIRVHLKAPEIAHLLGLPPASVAKILWAKTTTLLD
jgi:hypothetical protein